MLNPGWWLFASIKCVFQNFKSKGCTPVHPFSCHRATNFLLRKLEKSKHCFRKVDMPNYLLFHVVVLINTYRKFVMLISLFMTAFETVFANAWISDFRYPCKHEIRAHLRQKKILWNDCRWLFPFPGFPNLRSLFSGLVPFCVLDSTSCMMVLMLRSSCYATLPNLSNLFINCHYLLNRPKQDRARVLLRLASVLLDFFLWIELQMFLRCCLIHNYYYYT